MVLGVDFILWSGTQTQLEIGFIVVGFFYDAHAIIAPVGIYCQTIL